jgi:hypothetical protein
VVSSDIGPGFFEIIEKLEKILDVKGMSGLIRLSVAILPW